MKIKRGNIKIVYDAIMHNRSFLDNHLLKCDKLGYALRINIRQMESEFKNIGKHIKKNGGQIDNEHMEKIITLNVHYIDKKDLPKIISVNSLNAIDFMIK